MPIGYAFGDGEGEGVDAVNAVGFGVAARPSACVRSLRTDVVAVEILVAVGWAPFFDRIDDFPILGIDQLLRIGLVGDGDLAASATVDGRVRAVVELPR